MSNQSAEVQVVDSHVGGAPVRVVISKWAGEAELGGGTWGERVERFGAANERLRRTLVGEPRGSEAMVGAILAEPMEKGNLCGVMFFNANSFVELSVHGVMGVIATLARRKTIGAGLHRIETAAGVVEAELHGDGRVTVASGAAFRKAKGVVVDVRGIGRLKGDVAWGGNWFFIVEEHAQVLEASNVEDLSAFAWKLRRTVNAQWHPEVDHVMLLGDAKKAGAQARSFVLCPGGVYDRSASAAGVGAKMACLAADGKLGEGNEWVVEGILGSRLSGKYRLEKGKEGGGGTNSEGKRIVPRITGRPYVMAEGTLVFELGDTI